MVKYRDRRVAQEILKEVNDILHKKVRDPRVEGATITEVDVTGDLQQATIYYSTLDDNSETFDEVQKGFEKASGLIRKELGHRLSIYKTPELFFQRDESVAYGNRIDELLREMKNKE